jgi:hypothetical protein
VAARKKSGLDRPLGEPRFVGGDRRDRS